jgi:hypothetical protein
MESSIIPQQIIENKILFIRGRQVGWVKRMRTHHSRKCVGGFGVKNNALIHPTGFAPLHTGKGRQATILMFKELLDIVEKYFVAHIISTSKFVAHIIRFMSHKRGCVSWMRCKEFGG